jgi:hypothetical protein
MLLQRTLNRIDFKSLNWMTLGNAIVQPCVIDFGNLNNILRSGRVSIECFGYLHHIELEWVAGYDCVPRVFATRRLP